jgi:integrase
MARSVGLTDSKIAGLKAAAGERPEYPDDLVKGLRVRVGSGGAKTFTYRARFGGKPRNFALGQYDPKRFTLAAARDLARKMQADITEGRDPAHQLGRRPGDDGRLKGLVELYFQREVRGRKRTADAIERTFKVDILPVLGERLADTITRADITKLVEQVTFKANRETPRQGRMVHQLLSAFFNWALPRLDRLEVNPCVGAWRPAVSASRDRVLDDDELKALWNAAGAAGEFGKGVRLLMLTGQRRSEVLEATWDEFDLKGRVWTIPAARAKNGKASLVPLSAGALDVLKGIDRQTNSDFLFPAKGNPRAAMSGFTQLWGRVLKAVEKDLGRPVERFTMHDIRRTLATGLQRLGTRLEVTEAVLNHQSGSKAGIVAVYQRHHFADEKRHALDAWAAELERLLAGEGPAEALAGVAL